MILIDRTYLRNYEIAIQEELNKTITRETQNKNVKKVKRKKGKNPDNNIYKDLKRKISVANKSQKSIKQRLSQVHAHEEKVKELESMLNKMKSKHQKAIKEGNQEQIREKIKIKNILTETNNLMNEYNLDLDLSRKKNTIDVINQSLKNIQSIKIKLSQYKSKLLDIQKYVSRTKKDYETKEEIIRKNMESEKYINQRVLINPTDFIFIGSELDIGIIINIFV